MKKTLLHIIKLTGFFAAFYIAIMMLIASSTVFTFEIEKFFFKYLHFGSHHYQRVAEFENWLADKNVEKPCGLVTGSSSICLNINTSILSKETGIDFFMAGNDGQPISNSLSVLKYCLRSGKKIDYFILGIDPLAWDMKDDGSALEWIVCTENPYQQHLLEMARTSRKKSIPILYSYLLVKRLLPYSKNIQLTPLASTHYVGKGYVCSSLDRKKIPFEDSVFGRTIQPVNYNATFEIIQLCKDNNITLMMLKPKLVNFYGNADTLDKAGAMVINAKPAPVDTSLYFDNYHMYCEGGTIYSQWIAGEINKINQGVLP